MTNPFLLYYGALFKFDCKCNLCNIVSILIVVGVEQYISICQWIEFTE